jgi:hypothetical protein
MIVVFVAVVVVVLVGIGAYLLINKPGSSNNAAGATPTVSASTPTASAKPTTKPTAKAPNVVGSATATGGYVLSTPATAGGYPMGTDPHFLATTTATATAIEQSAVSGDGGTIAGSPVSASYVLPAEQTIEFVGYQGTFNPSTVMTNLGTFGADESTYPAGKNGGQLACANVAATATAPSGAVCVWVTKSTLGVTEFFDETGPEILTIDQFKGAEVTVNLRSSVETLKSS